MSRSSSELATTHATAASPETFTEVLIMSRILSTAKIKPIASKGSPKELKIRANVIVPADGTAAAPIAKKIIKNVLERHELRKKIDNLLGEQV